MRIPVRIDTSMLASAKDSRNHLIQSIVTTPSTLVPASSRCLLLDDDVVQGAHQQGDGMQSTTSWRR